jgi:alpha-glucoside transport system permease protein
VLTGGNFESQVLANSMFEQMFRFRDFGHASAIAMALLIVVTPMIIINVRNLRRQGIGA